MKRLFTVIIALACFAMLALPAAAQENEPPTWQALYWQAYWSAMEDLHAQGYEISLLLWDMNNDGVLDLDVRVINPSRASIGIGLIATIINGELRYTTELDIGTLHLFYDRQTSALRLISALRGEFSPRGRSELLVNWDTMTIESHVFYRSIPFEEYYLVNRRVLRDELNRVIYGRRGIMGDRWWDANADDSRHRHRRLDLIAPATAIIVDAMRDVQGETYDDIRESFFAALAEIRPDGTLYVQPIEGLYPAETFMEIRVPFNPLRPLQIVLEQSLWISPTTVWVVVIVLFVLCAWAVWCLNDRRKQRRAKRKEST
ncbi:MAG: hypothetical protein FWB76_05110 [Oscillospiraceae bacterium]|nr:hypothetical protein [Oscillospiraceae bacterium]